MTTIAYKFTRPGGVSPFRDFEWPVGEWVEAQGELGLCANGVHACRVEALPRWVDEELWRVEVDEVALDHEGVLVARRGRVLEQIEAWDPALSRELARSCAARALELAEEHHDPLTKGRVAMIVDVAGGPDPSATALSMYLVAHTADELEPDGYKIERARQAEWLRQRLALDA
ncbi:MAG TPA: hypothetical protein VLA69_07055 [Gaiellaceae bacterium]|nr:hypothetical protein [Gaiellaceae bacterium]